MDFLALECGSPVEGNLDYRISVGAVDAELRGVAFLYSRAVDLNLKFVKCVRLDGAFCRREDQSLAWVFYGELNVLVACCAEEQSSFIAGRIKELIQKKDSACPELSFCSLT